MGEKKVKKENRILHISGYKYFCYCGGLLVPSRFENHLRCMEFGCNSYYKIIKLSREEEKQLLIEGTSEGR